MEFGTDGQTVVVKLSQGEDLLPSLIRILEEEGVASGVVLAGIGALRDFELGWFDPQTRAYVRNGYGPSYELLSLQGTVTLGAEPPVHVHAALGDGENRVVGGHLFGARVAVLAEIAIHRLEGLRLDRRVNPATGLRELTIRRP